MTFGSVPWARTTASSSPSGASTLTMPGRIRPARLDEHGEAQRAGDLLEDPPALGPPAAGRDEHVRGDVDPGRLEDDLHVVLVHAGGRCEDAAADVGHAGHLEHALERPVLAEGPVQQGEDHVHGPQRRERPVVAPARGEQGAVLPRQLDEHLLVARGHLAREARGLQPIRIPDSRNPRPVPADADGENLVSVRIHRPHDGRGGQAGHRVFAGHSAVDEGNAHLRHILVAFHLREPLGR